MPEARIVHGTLRFGAQHDGWLCRVPPRTAVRCLRPGIVPGDWNISVRRVQPERAASAALSHCSL